MTIGRITIFIVLAGLTILFWIRPDKQVIVNRQPVGNEIICFGDSLTAGVGAVPGQDYPSQLARMLDRDIVNLGRSGDTTASALSRLDQVLDRHPGFVLLTLGGNDIRRGISRETVFANLEEIIRSIQQGGALVVLGGIDIPFFTKGFGTGYRELAKRTGSVLVPNVFEDIWGKANLMSDQIHPNSQGYSLMAEKFRAALEPYLPQDR